MWLAVTEETVNRLPHHFSGTEAKSEHGRAAGALNKDAEEWRKCIDDLLAIRLLEDDWDGQGTEAPKPELVDSAIILAVLLRQKGVEPPCRTVQGVTGNVVLEWQWGQMATAEIEIIEPYLADVYVMVPGQEVEQWQIRGAGLHESVNGQP
jgi:hypothetical protein